MTARRCTGAVIAGGRGTRMGGRAKGLERVGSERMIDRVAAALREAADDLILVANDPGASNWLVDTLDTRVVRDEYEDAGALAGIHAALGDAIAHAHADILVLPWDAPFVPGALLKLLRQSGERAGADAAVASSPGPWGFEPLCAWYAPACRAAIETRLDAGDLRAGAWLDDVHAIRVDVSDFGDPALLFFNVNTDDDLREADALVRRTR
jgi:molybdopterin-guanine dinucleotide biosynthesis protein A